LDVPKALAPELVTKLNFYKLRAKVIAEGMSAVLGVMAVWGGQGAAEYGLCYPDPRLPALGTRIMLPPHLAAEAAADIGATLVDAEAYDAHRIALGIPRGGHDFIYGDTFPHEADMDQLHGVDFAKGCYVVQGWVSRMEHRGTARTRIIPFAVCGEPPAPGTGIVAGGKSMGRAGSGMDGRVLGLVRLDRIADALAAGQAIEADGITLVPEKPDWAGFAIPGTESAA
jgi:folate-binding protein YgfZ